MAVNQGLAVWTLDGDGKSSVSMPMPLDDVAFAEALSAAKLVHGALRLQTIELLRSSYEALMSTMSFHSHLAESDEISSTHAAQHALPGLASLLFGWLSTGRLFLEHGEASLSAMFGKDSTERDTFEKATNWAYDHSVGYRFSYKLRNAFQHVGMPALSITIQRDHEENRNELRLVADRDRLLEEYDSWGVPVRRDLEAMPPQFDINPLISGAMAQFEWLAGHVREPKRLAALGVVDMLDDIIAKVGDVQGATMLMKIADTQEDEMKLHTLPISASDTARVRKLILFSSKEPSVQTCIGSIEDGKVCGNRGSAVAVSPHADGVALVPICDLHQRGVGRWAHRELGAAMLLHPGLVEYMIAGLQKAGHIAGWVTDAASARCLRRTSEPLLDMKQPYSKAGWSIPTNKDVTERTERAVHVVSVWAEEGGGTPRFFETVNDILQQDGKVEPLLTGLINLSSMLVSMVSTLLGRTPQVILGGLRRDLSEAAPP